MVAVAQPAGAAIQAFKLNACQSCILNREAVKTDKQISWNA